MLYSFDKIYDLNNKTSYRVFLEKDNKSMIVILDIYMIKNNWYLNIKSNSKNLHIGQKINSFEDLFEMCKRRYKEFPNVKLMALPINLNGFDVEFNHETAGKLQDLMVVV